MRQMDRRRKEERYTNEVKGGNVERILKSERPNSTKLGIEGKKKLLVTMMIDRSSLLQVRNNSVKTIEMLILFCISLFPVLRLKTKVDILKERLKYHILEN